MDKLWIKIDTATKNLILQLGNQQDFIFHMVSTNKLSNTLFGY